jgi:photosystem II stability/assembly factor-like uncharacterized protein
MSVHAIIGTDKGGFVMRSDAARQRWTIVGPLFKGWKVTAAGRDDRGRYFAATSSFVYGAALHVSDDLETWRQIEHGPDWPKGSGRKLNQIWTLHVRGQPLYAGVDEAGLFSSDDGGETWMPVEGLNEHPTRDAWYPGAGGLCAHSILVDPLNRDRVWCGISAVGVFRTDDGGRTWHTKNEGIPPVVADKTHQDIGRCNHGLAADPTDANVIYRREHNGMFLSRDGGETWRRIEEGLDSWFGFPIALHGATRTIFTVPLESDEYRMPADGRFRVARSRDDGASWEHLANGLPQEHAYMGVLRGAMEVDALEPCGVYVGTTAGTVFVSRDAGDSWSQMPCCLPRILWVSVFTDA